MSSNVNTYIGCYLELPIKKVEMSETIYYDMDGRSTLNRFNANTGKANIRKIIKVKKTVKPSSWIDADKDDTFPYDEDMFSSPEYLIYEDKVIFILNCDTKFNQFGNFDYEGSGDADLTYVNIKELISEFADQYEPYIDYYVKKYGSVAIKFGVVSYWS